MWLLFLTISCALSLSSINADTASLRAKFSELKLVALFPGDSSYNKSAAPFNRRFTFNPAAIVFLNDTQAVADSVKLAAGENLPVSARSGEHSYAAYGLGGKDGALVVDLSRLNTVSVDRSTGTAHIGSRNRLGDLAIGLNAQAKRAIPHGICGFVGIGGHAAFGGLQELNAPWPLSSSGFDFTSEHQTFYAKSITTPGGSGLPISNASIQAFSEYVNWFVEFELYGGANSAVTAVPKDATAFCTKINLLYTYSLNDVPLFPEAGFIFLDQTVASIVDNNASNWAYGAYSNHVDDRLSADQWNYQRLTQVKSKYDPTNVFSFPQSITE
ncbi:hypothetical protein CROQUDRAFT_85406 [Cronartium quercuum f. sp. fusiforme G11]|uniref:FAD-binding PCMH-type domain-containing protein n=1 Tax=Cronartium quercuum f. sp. fusiforme G11 TaxID=708437 RepID=A0A9P6TI29_9BASI|nr:hypothetical protein CROQUDRAFT_85406 [Cronartium quercuum f. sp. fusiforme G11]